MVEEHQDAVKMFKPLLPKLGNAKWRTENRLMMYWVSTGS